MKDNVNDGGIRYFDRDGKEITEQEYTARYRCEPSINLSDNQKGATNDSKKSAVGGRSGGQ